MAKKGTDVNALLKGFSKLPTAGKVIVLLLVLGVGVYVAYHGGLGGVLDSPAPSAGQTGPPGTKLFCFWNVENLYDDEDETKLQDDMEDWFGNDPNSLQQKVDHLVEAITSMNGGAGPDILAMCEIESERSLELLQTALNAKLGATGFADQKYDYSAFIKNNTGRRIATAVLSRIQIEGDRVKRFGKGEDGRSSARTLRVPLRYNGHELIVMVSHWTSRVRDDTEYRRIAYADDTYGEYKATMLANPDADVILCGDFNDQFENVSIRDHLHATTAEDSVRGGLKEPWTLALSGSVDRNKKGTLVYEKEYFVFDHILTSRGLLDDRGWSYRQEDGGFEIYDPDFMSEPNRGLRGPFAFGRKSATGKRGYSDHFPVTVRLYVSGPEVAALD